MYKVRFSSEAKNQFKKLKAVHKQAVGFILEDLKETPFLGKPLQRNLNRRFSYRIGVYRLVYKIDERECIVTIITIDHRSVVYN